MALAVKSDALSDALSDLYDMAKSGDWSDDFVALVAQDYGLNAALLGRKFNESFGSPEKIRQAFLAHKAGEKSPEEKAEELRKRIEWYCHVHQSRPDLTYEITVRVDRFTVIANKPYQEAPTVWALRHKDLKLVELKNHKYEKPKKLVD